MRISNMRYLVEVSKWKSINKVSKNLYINQQQLSRIIAQIEKDLEVQIFIRNNTGITLTVAGEQVVKKFESIIAMYDSINDIRQGEVEQDKHLSGKLNIMTDINIWTSYSKLYKNFIKDYPNVDLAIKSMSGQEVLKCLLENKADGIGLFTQINGEGIENIAIPDELDFFSIAEEVLMVYGSHDNPYINKYRTISLSTLSQLPLINFKPYTNYPSLMEKVFAKFGTPNIRYEVSDIKVFDELVKETDCLFVSVNKPKYTVNDQYIGIPIRNKITYQTGVLKHKEMKKEVYNVFVDYYIKYYSRLY